MDSEKAKQALATFEREKQVRHDRLLHAAEAIYKLN